MKPNTKEILALERTVDGKRYRVWWGLDYASDALDLFHDQEAVAAAHLNWCLANKTLRHSDSSRIEFCGPAPMTRDEGLQRTKDELAQRRDEFNRDFEFQCAPTPKEPEKPRVDWLKKDGCTCRKLPNGKIAEVSTTCQVHATADKGPASAPQAPEQRARAWKQDGRCPFYNILAGDVWYQGGDGRWKDNTVHMRSVRSDAQWPKCLSDTGYYTEITDPVEVARLVEECTACLGPVGGTAKAVPGGRNVEPGYPRWKNKHSVYARLDGPFVGDSSIGEEYSTCGVFFGKCGFRQDAGESWWKDDKNAPCEPPVDWLRTNGHGDEADRLEGDKHEPVGTVPVVGDVAIHKSGTEPRVTLTRVDGEIEGMSGTSRRYLWPGVVQFYALGWRIIKRK